MRVIHISEQRRKFQIISDNFTWSYTFTSHTHSWNTADYIYLVFRTYISTLGSHCHSILQVVLYMHTPAHTLSISNRILMNTINCYIQYSYLRINHCSPSGTHVTTEPKVKTLSEKPSECCLICTLSIYFIVLALALSRSPPCACTYTHAEFDSLLLLVHLPVID